MKFRTVWSAPIIMACLMLSACSTEDIFLQPEYVFGTYQLTFIDGEPLPTAGEWVNGRKRSTISGFLDLNSDSSWRRVTVERREYQDGSPTETETYDWGGARWVLEGRLLYLTGSGVWPGVVSRDRIEVGRDEHYKFGPIWVYTR